MTSPNRIDVHHHFVPAKFAEAVSQHGTAEWPLPQWTVSASQSLFKARSIATGILSVTTPGVDIASSLDEQLSIARDANNTGAAIRDNNPDQFGFFATIPNPVLYPTEALAETVRALDELDADGLTLLTSYSGKYLGDESFAALWAELNRRKAVVFIHPTSAPGPQKLVNDALLPPSLDFTFETTKTACDLILSETITHCPDVKIILSHGGGTLPWSWHRVALLPASMNMTNIPFEQFEDQAKSFYFDTALTGWNANVDFLLEFAKPGHVLYGSDFPYANNACIEDMTKGLDDTLEQQDQVVSRAVNWGNALELFPRLKQYRTAE